MITPQCSWTSSHACRVKRFPFSPDETKSQTFATDSADATLDGPTKWGYPSPRSLAVLAVIEIRPRIFYAGEVKVD